MKLLGVVHQQDRLAGSGAGMRDHRLLLAGTPRRRHETAWTVGMRPIVIQATALFTVRLRD
jgi:hypothetical protein